MSLGSTLPPFNNWEENKFLSLSNLDPNWVTLYFKPFSGSDWIDLNPINPGNSSCKSNDFPYSSDSPFAALLNLFNCDIDPGVNVSATWEILFKTFTNGSSSSDQTLFPPLQIPLLKVESTRASVNIDSDVNGCNKSAVPWINPSPNDFVKDSLVSLPSAIWENIALKQAVKWVDKMRWW